jgi:GNAT superfamily N-acetyltransferase
MLQETKTIAYPIIIDIEKEVEEFSFVAMRTLNAVAKCEIARTWLSAVAVDGGVSKGFLFGGLCSRLIGQPKYYFLGEVVYVTPKFRSRGLGQELVNFAASWAIANGARALEVSFNPGSEAHKNWARMGFRSYTGFAVFADEKFQPILDYPCLRKVIDGDNARSSREAVQRDPQSGNSESLIKKVG